MPRLIDISVPLENDVAADPPGRGPHIAYRNHRETPAEMVAFFAGLKPADLPDGEGWAVEQVNLSTHNGTHLDAPYHFASTMNRGERAITIDEVPLEWCFQPGVKLDFRHLPDDYVATGCGMGREATLFLLRQGVRVTGTDGWSWDAPFVHTREKYLKTGDAGLIWEGHKAGREIGYCHIEKLHNLEALPPAGFTVSCFPVKVRAGSAGWTRAVAILPE